MADASASSSSSLCPLIMIFFVIVLLLNNHQSSAQTHTNISSATPTLTPPSFILSPSSDFAFGFRPLETNPNLFLLAVWFNKITNRTVVWSANGDNPVANGSKLELITPSGAVSLKDPTGSEIWNPSVSSVSSAAILDTGNFVLQTADSEITWQSFEHPTDTLLPGQVMEEGSQLYARLQDDDYSRGRFELAMQNDGNLVMYPVAIPTASEYDSYWSTATNGDGKLGLRLVFNDTSGSIYLAFQNGTEISILDSALSSGDYYRRATLDPDGVFRKYVFQKNEPTTASWEVKGSIASDICDLINTRTGSGACGFNSYCMLDDNQMPVCRCPPYYSFIDSTREYQGCKPDFVAQSCDPSDKTPFELTKMENIDWPLSDAEAFSPMDDTQCRANCLQDCFCSVAIYNDQTCWKKKFPLSNGRQTGSVNRQAFIKFSRINSTVLPPLLPPVSNEKKVSKTWVLVGSLVLGSSVALNFLQLGACFLYKRRRRTLPPGSSSVSLGPGLRMFKYKELEEATNGFNEELGKGGFGVVYKGVLPSDPDTLIAVKKLESLEEEGMDDFDNEVKTIGQTHHKNLVRMLGFCKEGKNRLLVYEYMSNGSLYKFIFGSNQHHPDWPLRMQITLGIARGLAYLHEECRTQIIHCDIKPHNILLDNNMVAKISDFGMAKLLRLDQTRTSTGFRGTIGYFAPEWFKNMQITSKVDVYSFGVVLLEIVCCRKNFEWTPESQEITSVVDWAKECCRNGRLDLLVEEDEDAKKDGLMLERFVMVGISCVQEEPWLRPSMKKVVQMLEGTVVVTLPPNLYSIHL